MAVDVTVDPDVTLLTVGERLEQLLDVVHLRMKLLIRADPLSIQIDTCDRISVIATDDTIRIQDRYEYKSVELPQELGLFAVRAKKIEDALEHGACWSLARVHTR